MTTETLLSLNGVTGIGGENMFSVGANGTTLLWEGDGSTAPESAVSTAR